MVRTFKNALKLIFWDWSTLLLFELLYKSAALAVAIPALKALLDYAIQQAGLRYLTMDTLPILMRNPTAVLLAVGTICVYAVYIFIEMTAIVQYFDNGVQGKWTGAGQLFLSAVRRAFRILKATKLGNANLRAADDPYVGTGADHRSLWLHQHSGVYRRQYFEDAAVERGL